MKAANRSSRRHFLKAGALFSSLDLPFLIPGSVLGLEPPSNRLTMGGIGVGNRGRGVLASFLTFPEVQFVMNADVQRTRREMVKEMVDQKY